MLRRFCSVSDIGNEIQMNTTETNPKINNFSFRLIKAKKKKRLLNVKLIILNQKQSVQLKS